MVKHGCEISAVLTTWPLGPPLAGIFVSDFVLNDTTQIATLSGKSLSSNLAFHAPSYFLVVKGGKTRTNG